ncbi:MAG: hypothetical protein MJY55_04385 [Bacteroidales bacterium]|nr:hypothetical protein [Bacteroidales bacterium]
MKKNIIIATVAAVSALLVSISCTKQDDVQSVSEAKVFTATIEQGLTKTTLKETLVCWNEKDLININGSEYSATPNREKPASATFTLESGVSPQAPYRAIYPASLYNKGEYCFPDVQYYQSGRFNAPMYASSSSESLAFNNICGVICLRLKSQDESETIVSRIVLATKGELVSGPFKVDKDDYGTSNWKAYMTGGYNSSNIVTLDCGEEGVTLNQSEPKEFYIYLPPQSYQSGMTVTIESTNPDSSAYETHTTKDVEIFCNSVYSFTWEVKFGSDVQYVHREAPSNALSGHLFTVGPKDIDKVYFSKGNLRALYNGEVSWTFAENQFEFIGNTSGNEAFFAGHSLYNNNVIDLFTWSVEGNQYGVMDCFYDNSFKDWGSAINGEVWSTLSGGEGGEWKYLFTKRFVNGGQGENFSYEIVNNTNIAGKAVSGIAIFPDGFTNQGSWKAELDTWNKIAEAGIVFLPLAGWGYFNESKLEFWPNSVYYWSSSDAWGVCYSAGDKAVYPALYVGSTSARCAVRLVSRAFVPQQQSQDIILVND